MKRYVIQDIRYNGQSALRIYLNHQIVWQLWDVIEVQCLGESQLKSRGHGAFAIPTQTFALGASLQQSAGEGAIYYIPSFYLDGRDYCMLFTNGLIDVSGRHEVQASAALVSRAIAHTLVGDVAFVMDSISEFFDIVGVVNIASFRELYSSIYLQFKENAQSSVPQGQLLMGTSSLGRPSIAEADSGALFLGMTSTHLYFLSIAHGSVSVSGIPYEIASNITNQTSIKGIIQHLAKVQSLKSDANDLMLFASGPLSIETLQKLYGKNALEMHGNGLYSTLRLLWMHMDMMDMSNITGMAMMHENEDIKSQKELGNLIGEGRTWLLQDLFFTPFFGRALSSSQVKGMVKLRELIAIQLLMQGDNPLTTERNLGAISFWYQPYGDGELLDIYDNSIEINRGGNILKLIQTYTASVNTENNEILEVS